MKKRNAPMWLKLDNAAKIFPSTSSKRNTRVFRLAVQLKEIIDEKILQEALNTTLEKFPMYKSVLKKGLFWYYLETSDITPKVLEEHESVCSPIYNRNRKTLLFKVTYYRKRINLEVYHALADGAGALEFFRSLVAAYLVTRYKEKFKNIKIDLEYDASMDEKIADSFKKYYDNSGSRRKIKRQKGFTIKGRKYSEYRQEVIEGLVSTKKVLDLAHKYNTTVTILIAAILFIAIKEEMSIRERKRPIVFTIPVNFRQYFKSLSARNFFGIFNVGYKFQNHSDKLEDVIEYLNVFFKNQLNFDEMSAIINSLTAFENNILIRGVPLFIKNIVLKTIHMFMDKKVTAALSNVGRIKMPECFDEYINHFDVFTSTNKFQICICSYLDTMVMSFTSPFVNTNIQRNFFTTLVNLGIPVTVTSNRLEDDKYE